MSEVLIEWPVDELPVPLKGDRKHRFLTNSLNTQFDTRRFRTRRQFSTPLFEAIEVVWNFTRDEFYTFEAFFKDDLVNGSLPFSMDVGESEPLELAFLQPYSFSRSDNLFSVVGLLEVYIQDGESGESGDGLDSGEESGESGGDVDESGESGESAGIGDESGQAIPDGDPDPGGSWDQLIWLDYYASTTNWASLTADQKHAALILMDDFIARVVGVTPSDYILYWDFVASNVFDKQLVVKAASGSLTYGDGTGDNPALFGSAYALFIKYNL